MTVPDLRRMASTLEHWAEADEAWARVLADTAPLLPQHQERNVAVLGIWLARAAMARAQAHLLRHRATLLAAAAS